MFRVILQTSQLKHPLCQYCPKQGDRKHTKWWGGGYLRCLFSFSLDPNGQPTTHKHTQKVTITNWNRKAVWMSKTRTAIYSLEMSWGHEMDIDTKNIYSLDWKSEAMCWLLQRNQHPLLIANYMVTIYALVWAMRKSITFLIDKHVSGSRLWNYYELSSNRGCFQLVLKRLCTFSKPPFTPFLSAHLCKFLYASSSSFVRGCATISQNTLFPLLVTHPPSFLFSPGTGLICGLRVSRGIEGGKIGANWKAGGNMKGRSWREKVEREQAGEGWC